MKKILSLLLVALVSVALYGQKSRIESGSLDFMKAKPPVVLSFTYEGTKVGKMTETDYIDKKVKEKNSRYSGEGDEWKEQYMHTKTTVNEGHFRQLFGVIMKSKGVTVTGNPDEANYEIRVNVDFLEPGFNAGGFVSKAASMNVTCRFYDKASGEEVAAVEITNASTDSDVDDDYSVGLKLKECYGKCGKSLAQIIVAQAKL